MIRLSNYYYINANAFYILASWLSLADRILRYYVSQRKPSKTLVIIVEFVMRVYVETWFEIKLNNKVTDGPGKLFRMMQRTKRFNNKQARDIALTVLQNNSFFAHGENILVAMLADEDAQVRNRAVNKILRIRCDDVEDDLITERGSRRGEVIDVGNVELD